MYKNILFITLGVLLLICLFYPKQFRVEYFDPSDLDPTSKCLTPPKPPSPKHCAGPGEDPWSPDFGKEGKCCDGSNPIRNPSGAQNPYWLCQSGTPPKPPSPKHCAGPGEDPWSPDFGKEGKCCDGSNPIRNPSGAQNPYWLCQSGTPPKPPSPPPPGPPVSGCEVVEPSGDWVWDTAVNAEHNSCSAPGTLNPGKMCKGDPTSIAFPTKGVGCFKTLILPDCNFNLKNTKQIDFDLTIKDCKNVWASFWATPAGKWEGGGKSGEMDFMELCPAETGNVYANWAGCDDGANCKQNIIGDNADNFKEHIRIVNDGNGNISIQAGNKNNLKPIGSFYKNIYSSNACRSESGYANCIYKLVADVWNGTSGDAGYKGCMSGKYKGTGKTDSKCSFYVQNLKFTPFPGKNPFVSDNPICKAMLA